MSYKVFQWGTGSVGKHVVKTILQRDSLELAGIHAYSPEKVGKDADRPRTWVLATGDIPYMVGAPPGIQTFLELPWIVYRQ